MCFSSFCHYYFYFPLFISFLLHFNTIIPFVAFRRYLLLKRVVILLSERKCIQDGSRTQKPVALIANSLLPAFALSGRQPSEHNIRSDQPFGLPNSSNCGALSIKADVFGFEYQTWHILNQMGKIRLVRIIYQLDYGVKNI